MNCADRGGVAFHATRIHVTLQRRSPIRGEGPAARAVPIVPEVRKVYHGCAGIKKDFGALRARRLWAGG